MNDDQERIGPLGYANDERTHLLISIFGPSILNPGEDFVQVALSIDNAITLRAELNAFIKQHGIMVQ